MQRLRPLSHLLLASHISLVLLFATLLLATGIGTIRLAVVAQSRLEAERAVSQSQQRMVEWQRELDLAAKLLAEQPTLGFYLQRAQLTKARALVRAFQATSGLDFVRVEIAGKAVAEAGTWPPSLQRGLRFDAAGRPWRVEARMVPTMPAATVTVASRLRSRLADASGSPLVAVELRRLEPGYRPGRRVDWQQALAQVSATGEPDTFEGIGENAAVRVASLRDDRGQVAALLVARVDNAWVDRRFLEWLAAFGIAILIAVALALGLAILLAARIGRPFAQLAGAAERLGGGDLETPVAAPDTLLDEPRALASGLERMRERVASLTSSERSQREELDALLDGVDEGIVGVDSSQRIHYANRQFLALLGREREELIGHEFGEFMTPIEAPPTPALPELPATVERFLAPGSPRPLVVRRLSATDDRQVLVVREENALEVARAMRDRILANLSHEFQTPLSAQMASIEMLRDHLRGGDDPIAAQLADAQYRGTLRLSQLVDNLLDSVRIESGEMRLRREAVDLPSVVTGAIELMKPLTDQREQRVEARLPEGPAVTGDAQRLFSVVVNLLANANKFAPDRSTIRVRVDWSADDATVWVEDEGPGLPLAGGANDPFAPFRRSPNEEPSQRGSGLGLAIVKAIVSAHEGEVLVAPASRGGGTGIGVRLPIEAPA